METDERLHFQQFCQEYFQNLPEPRQGRHEPDQIVIRVPILQGRPTQKMLELSKEMGTSIPTQLKHYRVQVSVPTKHED